MSASRTPEAPFAALYAQWLDAFRALVPGLAGPSEELSRKREQVAANQEWEDEGGALADTAKPGTKIPF